MYNLHPNYVSLIRHKKRYKYLWGKVQNYMPVKSEHQLKTRGRVTLEMFLDIVQMLQAVNLMHPLKENMGYRAAQEAVSDIENCINSGGCDT